MLLVMLFFKILIITLITLLKRKLLSSVITTMYFKCKTFITFLQLKLTAWYSENFLSRGCFV